MAIKLVFYYTLPQCGFSETWYTSGTDPQPIVDNLPNSLLNSFITFRNENCRLLAIRGSVVGGSRRSYLRTLYGQFHGTSFIPPNPDPAFRPTAKQDINSSTAVLRFTGNDGHTRRLYMRGLNDVDIAFNDAGYAEPSGRLWSAWDAMLNQIKKNAFAIQFTSLPPVNEPTWHNIGAMITNGTNLNQTLIQIPVAELAAFTSRQYIVIQGVNARNYPKFPRIAQIVNVQQAPALPGLVIAYAIPGGNSFTSPRARLTHYSVAQDIVFKYDFERFSEHKTGKPFGQLRGRSRGLARVSA